MSRKSITEPVVRVKEFNAEERRLTLEVEFYPLDEPSRYRYTRVNYYATIGGREVQMGAWHGYLEVACSKPWPARGPGKACLSSRALSKFRLKPRAGGWRPCFETWHGRVTVGYCGHTGFETAFGASCA